LEQANDEKVSGSISVADEFGGGSDRLLEPLCWLATADGNGEPV
jgi:hypothetical protein